MNQKQPYRSDEPARPYLHEIQINGRWVAKGMEVSVSPATNRPSGRYRFEYAQTTASGDLEIVIFGPTRRVNQRHRVVRASAIRTVHSKTT